MPHTVAASPRAKYIATPPRTTTGASASATPLLQQVSWVASAMNGPDSRKRPATTVGGFRSPRARASTLTVAGPPRLSATVGPTSGQGLGMSQSSTPRKNYRSMDRSGPSNFTKTMPSVKNPTYGQGSPARARPKAETMPKAKGRKARSGPDSIDSQSNSTCALSSPSGVTSPRAEGLNNGHRQNSQLVSELTQNQTIRRSKRDTILANRTDKESVEQMRRITVLNDAVRTLSSQLKESSAEASEQKVKLAEMNILQTRVNDKLEGMQDELESKNEDNESLREMLQRYVFRAEIQDQELRRTRHELARARQELQNRATESREANDFSVANGGGHPTAAWKIESASMMLDTCLAEFTDVSFKHTRQLDMLSRMVDVLRDVMNKESRAFNSRLRTVGSQTTIALDDMQAMVEFYENEGFSGSEDGGDEDSSNVASAAANEAGASDMAQDAASGGLSGKNGKKAPSGKRRKRKATGQRQPGPHTVPPSFNGLIRQSDADRWQERSIGLRPILEIIASAYAERMAADAEDTSNPNDRTTLPTFIVEFYLRKYGVKSLADSHVLEVINSAHTHNVHSRAVRTFGRLLGLFAPLPLQCSNFLLDALNTALRGPGSSTSSAVLEIGMPSYFVPPGPVDPSWNHGYTPSVRDPGKDAHLTLLITRAKCIDFISKLFKDEGRADRLLAKVNSSGLCGYDGLMALSGKPSDRLDLDLVMSLAIEEWETLQNDQTMYLRALFTAADIDHSRRIDFREFSQVCRKLASEITGNQISKMYREALLQSREDELDQDMFCKVLNEHGLGELPDSYIAGRTGQAGSFKEEVAQFVRQHSKMFQGDRDPSVEFAVALQLAVADKDA